MTFYREDLASARCAAPGCNHDLHDGTLVMKARCHPLALLRATYRLNGVLVLDCGVCDKPVVEVAVAARERAT